MCCSGVARRWLPGLGTGAQAVCGLRVPDPGVGRLTALCFFPSLSLSDVSCWDPALQPPCRAFPAGLHVLAWERWHVRCLVRGWPGERSGFPVICHHRAQQISGWRTQIDGKHRA